MNKEKSFIKNDGYNKVAYTLLFQGQYAHYIIMALLSFLIGCLFCLLLIIGINKTFDIHLGNGVKFLIVFITLLLLLFSYIEEFKNSTKIEQYTARRILIFGRNTSIYATNMYFMEFGLLVKLSDQIINLHNRTKTFEIDSDEMRDAGGLALKGLKVSGWIEVDTQNLDSYIKSSNPDEDCECQFNETYQAAFTEVANQLVRLHHYEINNSPIKDKNVWMTALTEKVNETNELTHIPFFFKITGVEVPIPASDGLRAALEAEEIQRLNNAAAIADAELIGKQMAAIKKAMEEGGMKPTDAEIQDKWDQKYGNKTIIDTKGAPIWGVDVSSGKPKK